MTARERLACNLPGGLAVFRFPGFSMDAETPTPPSVLDEQARIADEEVAQRAARDRTTELVGDGAFEHLELHAIGRGAQRLVDELDDAVTHAMPIQLQTGVLILPGEIRRLFRQVLAEVERLLLGGELLDPVAHAL